MMTATRTVRWFIAYWISRIGALLGPFFPTSFWYAMAWPFAELCYWIMPGRRRAIHQNLALVVGDAEAKSATRRVFHNYARYVIDFYQLPALNEEALRQRMEFHDWAPLQDALSHSKGVLLVTLHLGQAELGAGALSAHGYPVSAIAETFDYGPMNDFIQGLRRNLGMNVIPANKARMGILRCLSRGEALALMVDVVEPGDGVTVDFFGVPTLFSSAPARIALRTNSRILPGVIARSEDNPKQLLPLIDFDLEFTPSGDEEADVRALTQLIASRLEKYVRRFPDQWFAFRPLGEGAARSEESHPDGWKVWALKTAVRLGGLLPGRVAYATARLAGDVAYRFRHSTREDVRDNMRHVLGPDAPPDVVNRAAREAFRNVARYYTDLVQLPRMNLQRRLGKDVRLHNFDILKDTVDSGRGAIVVTAHYGNPEMGVQVGAILGLDILILAEPLQPPAFAETMRDLRSFFKPNYVDVSRSAVASAIKHLRSGGVLAITCDRDIQRSGTPLPFFGAVTRMPLGAVELAQRTGAALIPGYCERSKDGFDIYFEGPLELCDTGNPKADSVHNAKALLERVERWIASDPGQWMVLERIWKPVPLRRESAPAPAGVASGAGYNGGEFDG